MLSLTKKTDYALIALAHLARQGEDCASAREIADTYGVPLPLLMNILKTLTRSSLVQSVRGARGGYTLARPASQITLARLIEVLEGPIRFVQCADHRTADAQRETASVSPADRAACELTETCPVRDPARQVHDRLLRFLRSVSLAELTEEPSSGDPRPTVGEDADLLAADRACGPACSCTLDGNARVEGLPEVLANDQRAKEPVPAGKTIRRAESTKELSHADAHLSR